MAAQAFTNFAGNPGSNQPTSYLAADGHVGAPVAAFNPNSPTFNAASFPSGVSAVPAVNRLSLPVTATANTDFTLSITAGANLQSFTVYTTTAYGAVTDVKISIGSSAGGQEYVAQTSIKAAGVVVLTAAVSAAASAALLSAPNTAPNLFIRLTQTGTASATGAATLVTNYSLA